MEGYISIEEICQTIMKGITLDIYYLIMGDENGIFKSEIMREFAKYDETSSGYQKYRNKVDIGIAVLEATRLIESKTLGNKDYYFLTDYGVQAKSVVSEMLEQNEDVILFGSIITKPIVKGNINE